MLEVPAGKIISIHAPVKGATRFGIAQARDDKISIHAPVKGATRYRNRQYCQSRDFNPRTREGCD